jgi:two-component system sensor kinase FixL
LSGSLAHELNQPLTAVLSNAQAALRFLDHDPPNLGEVRDGLLHIVENDKRASEVIRRLRAMLRKEKLDYDALAINEIVQDVLRLINSDMLNRGITVGISLAPGLPLVSGDRVQLQQVLLNLAINACDAMQGIDGERTLTVCTGIAPGSGIEVAVIDNGQGIPNDDLERIFNPFVTTKFEGIGLGLAICRSIIQSHRGKLWATNNEGRGSTLHFTLPVNLDPPSQR